MHRRIGTVAILTAASLALGCSDNTPSAPKPTLSPSAEGHVGILAATKSVTVTNVLNNLSIDVPVKNQNEAAKICSTVELISANLLTSNHLTCSVTP